MEVHPCPEEFKQGAEVRPVVVLFGWLLAKSRHLHKYGELYHQHGADVITVNGVFYPQALFNDLFND